MGLNNMLDLLEKHGFQRLFKEKLLSHNGFEEGYNANYNVAYAIDEEKLFKYLETQKKYKVS